MNHYFGWSLPIGHGPQKRFFIHYSQTRTYQITPKQGFESLGMENHHMESWVAVVRTIFAQADL